MLRQGKAHSFKAHRAASGWNDAKEVLDPSTSDKDCKEPPVAT